MSRSEPNLVQPQLLNDVELLRTTSQEGGSGSEAGDFPGSEPSSVTGSCGGNNIHKVDAATDFVGNINGSKSSPSSTELSEPCPDSEIFTHWRLRNPFHKVDSSTGKVDRRKLLKFAEELWIEQAKESAERFDAYNSRLAVSNNELYQLVGFYSVFQGVLFTAACQSNLLCCPNVWIPISLCVLATLCTCVGIHLKLNEVKDFRDRRDHFNDQYTHRQSQISKLRRNPTGFKFEDAEPSDHEPNFFPCLKISIFGAVFLFSVIIGWGSYLILCKPGKPCS